MSFSLLHHHDFFRPTGLSVVKNPLSRDQKHKSSAGLLSANASKVWFNGFAWCFVIIESLPRFERDCLEEMFGNSTNP